MNKHNSIYATELQEEEPRIHLKTTFETFRNRLEANIKDNIAFKKKNVVRQSAECFEQLMKIKQQSNSHKKRVQKQEREFQEKVEQHIKQDISKWTDFQAYFKEGFDQLEHNLQLHRERNKEYRRRISMKNVQLKALMQMEKESHVRVSSLVKKAEERSSLTTKDSSIIARTQSIRTRIKTESSLPVLKPSRYDHIKTIQSEYDQQLSKPKRVMSYMQPIGTLRTREESSLTLLMELLQWYKKNSTESTEDNWFLKVLFTSRHFNKLISFLSANCASRKVQTKL